MDEATRLRLLDELFERGNSIPKAIKELPHPYPEGSREAIQQNIRRVMRKQGVVVCFEPIPDNERICCCPHNCEPA